MTQHKVVVVGTGAVGATYAYALLNQSIADEIVLIDMNEDKAKGEAMDLNHALLYADSPSRIKSGSYADCADADIVCITAGASQNKDLTRLDFVEQNTKIFRSIVDQVMASGFDGIFLIASNPVDIMTYVTWKFSGLPKHRVIGSGTILDTARYCYKVGEYFNVSPQSVNGYIVGEHGDSQVAAWSATTIGGKSVLDMIDTDNHDHQKDLEKISVDVRDAAQHVLQTKGATYYGIGMGLAKLTKSILRNENAIFPVSAYMSGEYGLNDMYIGVPSVINRSGTEKVIELKLSGDEQAKLLHSGKVLKDIINTVHL
ncbi:L-lactate dehydrogenase [Virgibacillus sp. W0181]|uniref:L-lactate dehydrogenase n=1 Tax=Virgibacillus sp. W0181 TaxID=3391581 RepID=UPI003F46036C